MLVFFFSLFFHRFVGAFFYKILGAQRARVARRNRSMTTKIHLCLPMLFFTVRPVVYAQIDERKNNKTNNRTADRNKRGNGNAI